MFAEIKNESISVKSLLERKTFVLSLKKIT